MFKQGDKVIVKIFSSYNDIDYVAKKFGIIHRDCLFHTCDKNLYIVNFDDGTFDHVWNTQITLDTEEITC